MYFFHTLINSPYICRLAVDWVSCYMDSVSSVCSSREYNYIFQYMKYTFYPMEHTLQCDVLSGNLSYLDICQEFVSLDGYLTLNNHLWHPIRLVKLNVFDYTYFRVSWSIFLACLAYNVVVVAVSLLWISRSRTFLCILVFTIFCLHPD